jgi:hypothetical protein
VLEIEMGIAWTFALLVVALSLLLLASWPYVFSMRLWVFADRGSFLNLDYLITDGRRLGVDAYYSYGLLPVLVQRVLFAGFGRGYEPILAANLTGLIAMAWLWALFAQRMSGKFFFVLILIAICPVLFWVNPNFPYTIVIVSTLTSAYLVLQGRYEAALAAAVPGCFSVPSIPLVLAFAIAVIIVMDWLAKPHRSIAGLFKRFAWGAVTYFGLGLLLGLIFGVDVLLATVLPFQGIMHYEAVNYGTFTTLVEFLFPSGAVWRYYVFHPPTWWLLCSAALFGFGIRSLYLIIRQGKLAPELLFVILCAFLHAVLVFGAYGPTGTHIIYDPILVAGVLGGVAFVLPGSLRGWAFGIFALTGLVSQAGLVSHTYQTWRNQVASSATAGLYAEPTWTREWTKIVDASRKSRLLLLSYSSGPHHYFPTLRSPRLWTLRPGQVFDGEKRELMAEIRSADIVALDLQMDTLFVRRDADIQALLGSLCLVSVSPNFKIWWNPRLVKDRDVCVTP